MVVVIMGVSGCGKTTVGQALATVIGARFVDADDFHLAANIAKMRRGEPLKDADRDPWLRRLRSIIDECLEGRETMVLACSALTQHSRLLLGMERAGVEAVLLAGPKALIVERMQQRDHFMPAALLDSQLSLLEPPADALVFDIAKTPGDLVKLICSNLDLKA